MTIATTFVTLAGSACVAALGIWAIFMWDRVLDRRAAARMNALYEADFGRMDDCPICGAPWTGYRSQFRIHADGCAFDAYRRQNA